MASTVGGKSGRRDPGPRTEQRRSNQTAAEFEPRGTKEREIGDFRILREVGRGGMGVVYEAQQISLDRRVALKVLPFAAMLDERQLVRFKTEAQAAARLNHPNIVPVFFVGCERGVHFYAMQFINGRSLASAIHRGKDDQSIDATKDFSVDSPSHPIDADATVQSLANDLAVCSAIAGQPGADQCRSIARMIIQAAEALEHAHLSGIVHRDIKPGNLLLDADSNLWVTDFGLARIEQDSRVTMTGDVIGTIRYMSPEQASSGRGVDHRTDIYSLGVTLYEALTLCAPFESRDQQTLLAMIAQRDPVLPSKVNPNVPAELDAIVLKAMEKEPAARYQSAQEFADDLLCFLENRPISAKRPSLAVKVKKWVRRHPAITRSAAVILFLLAGASSVTAVLLNHEKLQTDAEWRRAERNAARSAFNQKQAEASSEEKETLLYIYGLGDAAAARQNGDSASAAEAMRANPAFDRRKELRGVEWPLLHRSIFTGNEVITRGDVEYTATACSDLSADAAHLSTIAAKAVKANADSGSQPDLRTAAIKRDQNYIAAGDSRGLIRIWYADSKEPFAALSGHEGAVHEISFHPDGESLVSAGEDGTVRIWDLRQKREIHQFKHDRDGSPVMCARYSPQGDELVTGGDDNVARVWSIDPFELRHELRWHSRPIRTIAYSPNGKQLVTGSSDRKLVIWDASDGTKIRRLPGHDGMVLATCYAPSGQYILSGGNDATIRMWRVEDGRQVARIDGHLDGVEDLVMLPDERTLIAGDRSGQLRRWRTSGKRVVDHYGFEHLHFYSIQLSPDGHCWVGLRDNGEVYVRDLVMKRTLVLDSTLLKVAYSNSRRNCVAFSPDNRRFFCGDRILKRESATGFDWLPQRRLDVPTGAAGDFSADARWLVTGANREIKVWDPIRSIKEFDWQVEANKVLGVRFAPSGYHLAVWSDNSRIEIWDVETQSRVQAISMPGSHPIDVEWSPAGDQLAVCDADEDVFVVDVENNQVSQLDLGGVRCRAVSWNDDGRALVLNALGLYDVVHWLDGSRRDEIVGANRSGRDYSKSQNSSQLLTHDYYQGVTVRDMDVFEFVSGPDDILQGHQDRIWSLSLSPDGSDLISGSRDGSLCTRSVKSQNRWEWATKRRHPHHRVSDFEWSETGQRFLLSRERNVQLVAWPDGEPIHEFGDVGHSGSKPTGFICDAVSFHAAGKFLASGHRDGRVHLWRPGEARPYHSFQAFPDISVSTLELSPDGRILVAASRFENLLKIWDTENLAEIDTLVADDCDDMCFSRNGKWLLFCDGREVALWSTERHEVVRRFKEHSITVHGVAFATDGSMFATACEDRKLRLWNPDRDEPTQVLVGHAESIQRIAFSPDNRTLVSGDESGVVKLWNVETGQEIYTLAELGVWVRKIMFDPTGQSLMILTDDGLLHHFQCGELEGA